MINLESLRKINEYWQVLVFIIFLLGYVTFSFYLDMNGVPMTNMEIPSIIGLGLIVFLFIGLIILYSISNLSPILKIGSSFFVIFILYILNNFSPMLLMGIIVGSFFSLNIFRDIESQKDDIDKKNVQRVYDYGLAISIPFILLTFHWTYSIIFCTTFIYIFLFDNSLKIKKIILVIGTFTLLLSMTYLIALFINFNGLKVANLGKKNVEFIYKDKNYNSIMIYENNDYIYLNDNNKTISIRKENIDSEIVYSSIKYGESIQFKKNIELIKGLFNE